MLDLRTEERARTEDRNKRQDDRAIKMMGHENGGRYLAIANALVADVMAALPEARERLYKANSELRCLATIVSERSAYLTRPSPCAPSRASCTALGKRSCRATPCAR
jgi:hypothetical protein